MENVVFEKNLASHPKENSLSVSHRAENRICPLSNPTFGKLRSWQTSFPASTHIYRTVSLHLPIPLFFLFFLFVSSAHLFYIDIFSRKDKIRARGYTTRFAIYISRFHHVENSRWNRSFTSVAIAPRERIRMHKYVPPWNVLHLQFLFLNLFSRHLRPKFYGMSSNCISFFFFCFCLNCRSCSFCYINCIFWCMNKWISMCRSLIDTNSNLDLLLSPKERKE